MDKLRALAEKAVKIAFALLIIAQVAAPVYMIAENELNIRRGEELKFRVEPKDPRDPIRGNYVSLRFKDDRLEMGEKEFESLGEQPNYYKEIYVLLKKNSEGFAVPEKITAEKTDGMCVKATAIWMEKGGAALINYPFNKLFMNEKIAPLVDRAMMNFKGTITLTVYIGEGGVTMNKLYFDGVEASEFVKKNKTDQD